MIISPGDIILREQLPAELQKPQLGTTIAVSATAWILSNVRREHEIVQRLIKHLPAGDLQVANEFSGDLSLQGSLSALLVHNIIVTAIAFGLVIHGYMTSERSLHNVKVLATDILASLDAGVITTSGNGVERIEKLVRLLRPQAEKQNVTLQMNRSSQ